MNDRVVVVTGATNGIGRATAAALARRGARVVVHGRSEVKGRAVIAELRAQGVGDTLDLVIADLSSRDAVRGLAAQLLERYPQIHVLINNAGAIFGERRVTVDGTESTFALNHIAPFLLTTLLLDRLRDSGTPERHARVINLSSVAHRGATFDFADPEFERKSYRGFAAYAQSKLANILFTRELARRVTGANVDTNAVHPGIVSTGFAQINGGLTRVAYEFAAPFLIGPERGARTTVKLASDAALDGVTGKYFVRGRAARPSRAARQDVTAERLWAMSERYALV